MREMNSFALTKSEIPHLEEFTKNPDLKFVTKANVLYFGVGSNKANKLAEDLGSVLVFHDHGD